VDDPGTVVPGGPVPGLGGAVEDVNKGNAPAWPTLNNPTGDTVAPPTAPSGGTTPPPPAPATPPTNTTTPPTNDADWWKSPATYLAGGAALAGAGASIYSGWLQSEAAKEAAQKQADAAKAAGDLQWNIFEQQRADLKPWRDAGNKALGDLENFDTSNFYTNYADFGMNQFKADPGYGFRLKEGMDALQNSAAARGGLLSGNTLKGINNYAQDSASQEYQNAFNRYHTEMQGKFNRQQTRIGTGLNKLQSLAGIGQTAVQQSNQAGQNYANAAGNLGMTAAQAQAQGRTGSADAWASGIMGATNTGINALSGMVNSYYQNQWMNTLLGRR